MRSWGRIAFMTCLLVQLLAVGAIQVTIGDEASVKSASSTVAFGLMKYYTGNNTGDVPGNLPDPYFWWLAGAMFGTMVDYWFLTNDTTYNEVTAQALLHQASPTADFMPPNQTRTMGNDDQGFWAMAAMSAAENKFPDPPADKPQWLALAQAVFNQFTTRWDTETCNGGLRWQVFIFNNGYDFKNAISSGCFFNIAARLYRFTGNQTYAEWAERVYDWEETVGLITHEFDVQDGAGVAQGQNCTTIDPLRWSYNAGIHLHGAAHMYNVTGSDRWRDRVAGLLNRTAANFYKDGIMVEPACEFASRCNNDQQSFKAYLARWLAGSAQLAPFAFDRIAAMMRPSAEAAARACSGSPPSGFAGQAGTACGFQWTTGGFDGVVGVGGQMSALSAIMYTLATSRKSNPAVVPATSTTGGTSKGDPNAGLPSSKPVEIVPVTTGDRVAAGFLTVAVLLGVVGGSVFLILE